MKLDEIPVVILFLLSPNLTAVFTLEHRFPTISPMPFYLLSNRLHMQSRVISALLPVHRGLRDKSIEAAFLS